MLAVTLLLLQERAASFKDLERDLTNLCVLLMLLLLLLLLLLLCHTRERTSRPLLKPTPTTATFRLLKIGVK